MLPVSLPTTVHSKKEGYKVMEFVADSSCHEISKTSRYIMMFWTPIDHITVPVR